MKKLIVSSLAVACAFSVLAQGTISFNNGTPANGVSTRVYGPEDGNPALSLFGNTPAQTPAGTQTYTGDLLTGDGYSAQLWAAVGADALESSLVPSLPTTTFRTGSAAGVVNLVTATFAGIPLDAPMATVQMRVWDNMGGTITTWEQAEAAWLAGAIAAGMSPTFNLAAIGGQANTPPYPVGLQSFNIYYIPEPSTFALLGLGALGMFLFRRK